MVLKSSDAEDRRAAVRALKGMGPLAAPAVGELAQLLRDTEVQLDVVETLGQLGPVAEPAVSALTDELAGPIGATWSVCGQDRTIGRGRRGAPRIVVVHQRAEVRLAARWPCGGLIAAARTPSPRSPRNCAATSQRRR